MPDTVEHAKRRVQKFVDIFKRRDWTHEERSELKTIIEYLEARK